MFVLRQWQCCWWWYAGGPPPMARPPGSSSSFLAVGSYWHIILSLSMHRLASIHQVGLNQCLINPFIHSQIVFIIFRRRWRRRWGYREQQQFPNRPQFGTVERDFRRAPPRFGPETTPPGDKFNSKSGRPHRLDRGYHTNSSSNSSS